MAKTDEFFNVVDDFLEAELGDSRLTRRLVKVARGMQRDPTASIPLALDAAETEGAYRFIRNERVAPEAVLSAHCIGTAQRAARLPVVLVVHDTTTAAFGGGMRAGLGVIDPSKAAGFYLHSSFLVTPYGEPIGVANVEVWNRKGYVLGKLQQNESQYREDRESLRWMRGVEAVADVVAQARDPEETASATVIINVMDREADCLEFVANMIKCNHSFVIRAQTDRRLEPGRHTPVPKLFESVASTKVLGTRTIKVVCRVDVVRPVLSGQQCKCVSLGGGLDNCVESLGGGEDAKGLKGKGKRGGKTAMPTNLCKHVCLSALASAVDDSPSGICGSVCGDMPSERCEAGSVRNRRGLSKCQPKRLKKIRVSPRRLSESERAVDSSAGSSEAGKGNRLRQAHYQWTEVREATLEVRAMSTKIYGAKGHHKDVPTDGIAINIVCVQEVDAPEGVEPICWYLLTDQPIGTPEQVAQIIEIYRLRWLIEEWHKALKSGCNFQKHQFEDGDNFRRMLMIYMPIAVQMLRARWLDRYRPDAPATEVFSEDEIEATRIHEHHNNRKLPKVPTVRDVHRVIARLGGHLGGKRQPGWQILSRGYAKLAVLVESYRASREWYCGEGGQARVQRDRARARSSRF